MGTSFQDILNRRNQTPEPVKPQGLSSFADIAGGDQPEQQNSRFYNRFNNLWKLYKVSVGQGSPEEYAEVGRIAAATEGTMPGAMQKIGRDIINTLSYYGKKPPDPTREPGLSLTETLRGITLEGALAGIPDAFQSIITAPIESVLGAGLDKDTLYALTPEERAQSIKDSAANVAMFMAGIGAGGAVKGAYAASTASKLAKAAEVSALKSAAKGTSGGALKRTLVAGLAEGSAGGLTQSAISRLGEDDVWAQMAINGILFAPLGAAFETVKLLGKSTDKLGLATAAEADKLAQLRQLQVSTKDSFSGVMYKLDGLETADNLAEAVLSGKLRATPDRPVVVPGVTREELGKVISSIAKGETDVTPTFYQRPDGSFDMLVGDRNKLSPTARRSFSETGYVPNQLVDVNGKTYTFSSLSKDGRFVNLKNAAGRSVSKPRSEVRLRNDFETQDLTPANSGEQIYRDFKNHAMKDVPEKISIAAIRTRTGQIYEAPLHIEALEKARDAGAVSASDFDKALSGEVKPPVDDGFMTTRGRFISRKEAGKLAGQGDNFELDTADPIGFDENFWDGTPSKSFDDLLNTFAKERGFNEAETAVLERDLTQRLFDDTLKRLPDEERAVVEALSKEVEETVTQPGGSRLEQAQIAAKAASEDVIRKARSNGMYVDEEAAGNLTLRDAVNDSVIGRFKTTREAIDFIDRSGQADGVDLDGGGPLPPRMGSGLMPADGGPVRPAYVPLGSTKFGESVTSFNIVADWFTPNRNIIQSLDTKFGTQFFSKIYDSLNTRRMKANSVIKPWYERLAKVDKAATKLTKQEREIVGAYMETLSPDEVKARGGQGGRALNEMEIKLGEMFAAKRVDLSKVQQYIREIDEIAKEVERGKLTPEEGNALKADELQRRALSDNELEAVDLVRQTKDAKLAWFGSVVRLANSIMNKDVTRADFAKLHKMSPLQMRLAEEMDGMHEDLAKAFGISDEYRLENFMTHARLYSKGDISIALRDFDMPPAVKDFYAALARTGELTSYEKDPIRALQRYIKSGFDSKIMRPAIEKARHALREELVKLPDDARGKAERMINRYIDDVQGIPGEASKFTQSVVDGLLPKLGLKVSVDVRKDIVNLILATGEAAAQGFRVVAGMRDFYQGVSWYYTRFGLNRTLRMLEYGTKGLDGITKADLIRGGLIPELDVLFINTPTDALGSTLGKASNVIGRGLRKVSQKGLQLSGQKDVYAMLHAGSYLDTWKMAGENLTKLSRGELTRAAAYKNLLIDTYDVPVINEFDRLVNANQIDAAAKFLARNTGAEQVGVFGSGNNPGGWNRNVGRIFGQFGSWPTWYRAQVTQMLSRGTYGQRAAAMTRFAATQGALVGTSLALGIDLRNWYGPTSFQYSGGPILDFALTLPVAAPAMVSALGSLTGFTPAEVVGDAMGGSGFMQQAALGRLKRYLPYDPIADEFNVGQIYIPGSFFANDLIEAYRMAQERESLAGVGARSIGIRPAQ